MILDWGRLESHPVRDRVRSAAVLAAVAFASAAGDRCAGQSAAVQAAASSMPGEFSITYDASVALLTPIELQRKEYEAQLAEAKQFMAKNPGVVVGVPARFPGPAPERHCAIRMAESNGRFFWSSASSDGQDSFIFDGKWSYYYEGANHRMFVHSGFRLTNGMLLPPPGHGLANVPLAVHLAASSGNDATGEVFCGTSNADGSPMYLPGVIHVRAGDPQVVASAVTSYRGRKYSEFLFSDYAPFGQVWVPRHIVHQQYDQRRGRANQVALRTTYSIRPASSFAAEALTDPSTLLDKGLASTAHPREFVQWTFDDGKEIVFQYRPGRGLEEQAKAAVLEDKKDSADAESGRIDPRNYVGAVLLVVLLAAIAWRAARALMKRPPT